jgi:hypothetical protein
MWVSQNKMKDNFDVPSSDWMFVRSCWTAAIQGRLRSRTAYDVVLRKEGAIEWQVPLCMLDVQT